MTVGLDPSEMVLSPGIPRRQISWECLQEPELHESIREILKRPRASTSRTIGESLEATKERETLQLSHKLLQAWTLTSQKEPRGNRDTASCRRLKETSWILLCFLHCSEDALNIQMRLFCSSNWLEVARRAASHLDRHPGRGA